MSDQKPAEPVTVTPGRDSSSPSSTAKKPKEIGGRNGPEPTRFGDWEKNGRCIDF
ncbi:MAG: DUF1674 domain-containing protein [Pseudomonadota bacterium]